MNELHDKNQAVNVVFPEQHHLITELQNNPDYSNLLYRTGDGSVTLCSKEREGFTPELHHTVLMPRFSHDFIGLKNHRDKVHKTDASRKNAVTMPYRAYARTT